MPFRSKRQMRYLFAKHPKIAKKWAKKTPDIGSLPETAPKSESYVSALNSIFDAQIDRKV